MDYGQEAPGTLAVRLLQPECGNSLNGDAARRGPYLVGCGGGRLDGQALVEVAQLVDVAVQQAGRQAGARVHPWVATHAGRGLVLPWAVGAGCGAGGAASRPDPTVNHPPGIKSLAAFSCSCESMSPAPRPILGSN